MLGPVVASEFVGVQYTAIELGQKQDKQQPNKNTQQQNTCRG